MENLSEISTDHSTLAEPDQSNIHVPEGWSQPTYQIGEVVWHECQQYEVIGAKVNEEWDLWQYTVNRYPESAHLADPETLHLLEYQLGQERSPWCDQLPAQE